MIKNLVLDLDETLIHSFDSKKEAIAHGGFDFVTLDRSYYVKIRPGCLDFLAYALHYYRVGVYSVATADYVDDIVSQLMDPERLVFQWSREDSARHELPAYGLFQSSHQYTYKKPLSRVLTHTGWNLDETVVIDDSVAATGHHNANRLLIHPFHGELDDNHLPMVHSFLEHHRKGDYPVHLISFDDYTHDATQWMRYD